MIYVLMYSIKSCLVSIIFQNFILEDLNFYKLNNLTVSRKCLGPGNICSTSFHSGTLKVSKSVPAFRFPVHRIHGDLLSGGGAQFLIVVCPFSRNRGFLLRDPFPWLQFLCKKVGVFRLKPDPNV